jgi:methionyl-tRNA synthetase
MPHGAELPAPQPIFPRIDKKAYLAGGAGGSSPAEKKKPAKAAERKEPVEKAPPVKPKPAAQASANHQPARAGEEGKGLISIDKFLETELKVATVTAAERVPKSNKLLKLAVDLGEETRTLVAGIALQYEPEALVGRQVIIVANLEPAKLMGVESQGMVLAASQDGKPILLQPEFPVPNGTRVR